MKLWLVLPFAAFWIGIHYFQNAWAAILIYHLFLSVPLLVYRNSWKPKDFLKGFRFSWFMIHAAGCFAGYLGLIYLAEQRGFGDGPLQSIIQAFGNTGIAFASYLILINPLFEEAFWRDLQATKSKWPAFEDLAFGAFHAVILWPFLSLPFVIGFVFFLTVMAWVWRQIRWQTGGLAIPWIGHALGDAMFVGIVVTLLHT